MEPLRIGILGAARIAGRAVVKPAHALGARVVAVAARDLGRAQAYAERHDIARAYGSYDELLADPEVEVIYNPSPNSEHVRWTLAALRASTCCRRSPSAATPTRPAWLPWSRTRRTW